MSSQESFSDIIEKVNVMSQSSCRSEEKVEISDSSDSEHEDFAKVFKEFELERLMKKRMLTELPNFKLKKKIRKYCERRKEVKGKIREDLERGRSSSEALRSIKSQKPKSKSKNITDSDYEAAVDIPSKRYEEIESFFKCGICSNQMNTPVLLNCSHRFCKECISSYSQSLISCPECFAPIKKDFEFKINSKFCRIMKISKILKKLKTKEENLKKMQEESKSLTRELNYLNNLSYGYGDNVLESIVLDFRRKFVPNVDWSRNDLLNNQLLFTQKTATEINKITKSTSQTFDIELFGSVNI